ncbi:acyl-CoA N-acyltransferase [Lentithecium fluviatile CBS 122367]|uniref:Acyl-CoA N-acyltransferase n=1 Tax=Lentithecium fluviatile CBS 122367 TaxID=1168545 RepID=A0A6G1IXZ3_9PLEO|nr:acyl-CoA N-acyltransferase [Lentithecium fluviatile CBS 122367]
MSVVVEPYNPAWPSYFSKIKSTIQSYLSGIPILSIEHIGSTSVPHLAAKPIIDIDIIVTRENIQPAVDALVQKGKFTYLGELGIADRHALQDPDQVPKRNVYVCVEGAFQVRNHLGVRDTLKQNAELRDEYGALKLQLAEQGTNIVDYIEAKSGVVMKILKAAGLLSGEELEEIEMANKKGERFGATKTERLLLREFVLADVEGYFELESSDEVVRYQTFGPRTREEARDDVSMIVMNSSAVPRSHVELAVEHEGRFIGRVGAVVKRESGRGEKVDAPHADLWFSFIPEYQGKGFATEAVRAFVSLLGGPLELEIECDPRNTGSWKLAKRLGFERISLTEKVYQCKGEWVDSLVYRKWV